MFCTRGFWPTNTSKPTHVLSRPPTSTFNARPLDRRGRCIVSYILQAALPKWAAWVDAAVSYGDRSGIRVCVSCLLLRLCSVIFFAHCVIAREVSRWDGEAGLPF